MPGFLARVNQGEMELEFQAQIETVLAAGLKPSHLDWHALRIGGRDDIFDLMFMLAKEYGLALRVYGRSSIEEVQRRGLPSNDYDFLDNYHLDPASKSVQYVQMLRELPAGLSEWAIHPALKDRRATGHRARRQSDPSDGLRFFDIAGGKGYGEGRGIILLDYRTLQAVWRGK
jgi:chitin disaccharide deacetylase